MTSVVERQRAFIKRHSTIQPFWGEVEDISLISAALLTLGINPSSLDEEITTKWLWGDQETKLLRDFAATADKF
jgi:hypothetical protein